MEQPNQAAQWHVEPARPAMELVREFVDPALEREDAEQMLQVGGVLGEERGDAGMGDVGIEKAAGDEEPPEFRPGGERAAVGLADETLGMAAPGPQSEQRRL